VDTHPTTTRKDSLVAKPPIPSQTHADSLNESDFRAAGSRAETSDELEAGGRSSLLCATDPDLSQQDKPRHEDRQGGL